MTTEQKEKILQPIISAMTNLSERPEHIEGQIYGMLKMGKFFLNDLPFHLRDFSETNRNRAAEGFKTYTNVPITYWTTAIAGEVGELCNMIKKMERVKHGGIDGGSTYTAANITHKDLAEEIGGIFIYLDLLAGLLNIDLSEAIKETFNSKSEKYGFKQFV